MIGVRRPFRTAVALASLAAAAVLSPAVAQAPAEPPSRPFLRVETGMHAGAINRLATDARGTVIATASDDKTVRLWTAETGRLRATLRVPVGPADEGALYAVAMSPDGATVVAGGYTGVTWDRSFSLYLFDARTERLRGRLPRLPDVVNHLAFSPDGRLIAAAFAGKIGLRIWDARTGQLVAEDRDYGDRATWVAFDGRGRLATASLDGQVRLYDPAGKLLLKRRPQATGKPYSVAFSPDGGLLAVGYADLARVDVLSTRDLAPRLGHATADLRDGPLSAVTWTRPTPGSAPMLVAAGSGRAADGRIVARGWSELGLGEARDTALGRDTVFQLTALPDGAVAFAAADPAWGRIATDGTLDYVQATATADLRGIAGRRLALGAEGQRAEFEANGKLWRFDLGARVLEAVPTPDTTLTATLTQRPGLAITDWRNGTAPKVAGKPLALAADERVRSLAITADGQRFLFGTDYYLRLYDARGGELARLDLPAPAWGVTIAADGRTILAALGDGTLRWFGPSGDRPLAERLAVFPHLDRGVWVAWTPEGFFDHADQGGKDLVGWVMNRGRARSPDWISFAQAYRVFYAPQRVLARVTGAGERDATVASAAGDELRARFETAPPPSVELVDWCGTIDGLRTCTPFGAERATRGAAPTPVAALPEPVAAVATQTVPTVDFTITATPQRMRSTEVDAALPAGMTDIVLRFKVNDQGGGIGAVDFFVNNRNVGRQGDARDLTRAAGLPPDPSGAILGERQLSLEPGANRLVVRAYDSANSVYGTSREAAFDAGAPQSGVRPRLFVVAVGIDRYPTPVTRLGFAVADARSFAEVIKPLAGPLYDSVEVVTLQDAEATTSAIVAALERVARAAERDDTVLIYLAGHGEMHGSDYFYLTHDVELDGATEADRPARLARTALSGRRLVELLGRIPARNGLVFLDTCHSGAITLDAGAGQLTHESGRYVLAAASSVETALDSYDGKNGVFAYAVLQGLAGQADRSSGAVVDNFELGFYVTRMVPQLAREKRHQQSARFKIAAEDARPFAMSRPTAR